MDNLSGTPKYHQRGGKKKTTDVVVAEVIVDTAELYTIAVELKIKLDDMIERNNQLYSKFSKKQLNDFGVTLRMAKGNLKTLLDDMNKN